MPTYQLRLPEPRPLEDWLDEVAWGLWYELTHHTALESLPPHAYARVWEILHEVFESCVTTYRSCGLWSYCRAGTRPSPWMPEEAYRPGDGHVQWYLLEAPKGLPELVGEVTDRLGEFLACFIGGSLPRSVLDAAVETGLRRGLGRYLYDNPHCGTHAFCAERLPLNPWRTAEDPWRPAGGIVVGGAHV